MIEEDEEEKDVSEVNCVKSESTQSSLVIFTEIEFIFIKNIVVMLCLLWNIEQNFNPRLQNHHITQPKLLASFFLSAPKTPHSFT